MAFETLRYRLSRRKQRFTFARRKPPPVQEGMHIGPPDFVGVGVMKAGTTWWYQVITTHPRVDQPQGRGKEMHFFDRRMAGRNEIDPLLYHRWFPRLDDHLAGEWTTGYMFHPKVPSLLHQTAPDAKVLVMLRDPVARYVSGVAHVVDRGRSPSEELRAEQFARGLYADQLDRLLTHFERGQLLVLQYERCVADPQGEARRTFDFLGLDGEPSSRALSRRVNRSLSSPTLDAATREELVDAYRTDVMRLVEGWPEIDLSLWPNFSAIG